MACYVSETPKFSSYSAKVFGDPIALLSSEILNYDHSYIYQLRRSEVILPCYFCQSGASWVPATLGGVEINPLLFHDLVYCLLNVVRCVLGAGFTMERG